MNLDQKSALVMGGCGVLGAPAFTVMTGSVVVGVVAAIATAAATVAEYRSLADPPELPSLPPFEGGRTITPAALRKAKRSAAAKKGWATRRRRAAERVAASERAERTAAERKAKRRAAALKGWETRRRRATERMRQDQSRL